MQEDGAATEGWVKTKLLKIFEECSSSRIYNADETLLFYRVTPDGSLTLTKARLVGSKKAMDSMTVLRCAYLSRDDRH